jgi:hypothetical protein
MIQHMEEFTESPLLGRLLELTSTRPTWPLRCDSGSRS